MLPLATAGELNIHLQRTVDTDQAEQAVQLASGAVRAYCKWNLSRETTTLQADGSGTVVLTLPTLELIDVTAIRVGGVDLHLDPSLVSWTRRGQLLRAGGWPRLRNVEVDCTHGYDPVPDLLKLVVLEMAARGLNNPLGLVSATVGQVTRTWASSANTPALSDLDERLLERYAI